MKTNEFKPSVTDLAAELTETRARLAKAEATLRKSEAARRAEVSERQRVVLALTAEQEMHRAIFDLAAVGMACVGHDGRLERMNNRYCELTGYSRAELTGMPVLQLTHPEDREREAQEFTPYLQGQEREYFSEKRYLRKDGTVRWVSVRARPVRDGSGRLSYSMGTVEDITERKRSDERLRQLVLELKFHMENSPLAVIEFDSDLRISRWSHAAEKVFGWRAEEVLGKGMFEVSWVHPEDLPRIHHVSEQLRSGNDPRNVTPNRNCRKDGSVIHCEWYNSSLQDAEGKLVSILSLVLDVTARTKAEALLRSRAQSLEAFVQERTVKLKDTIGELHQISYALVHDLRAPLRAMRSFAELVERECSHCEAPCISCTQSRIREYHRRMIVATERLDRLVTDGLHYTKTLHQEVRITPVNLDALVRDLLQTYPNLLPDQANIRIDGTLPVVLGNEAFLAQCFANLLGNAVKFVAPGTLAEVRLWAERRIEEDSTQRAEPGSGTRGSSFDHSGSVNRIWIEDQGIGIPAEVQPRLFGMFQKFTPQYDGTGIGLAIVRKVVERMGGKVGVESQEGQGSRFWVELKGPESSN